jgi:hypothetical protein
VGLLCKVEKSIEIGPRAREVAGRWMGGGSDDLGGGVAARWFACWR